MRHGRGFLYAESCSHEKLTRYCSTGSRLRVIEIAEPEQQISERHKVVWFTMRIVLTLRAQT